MIADLDEARITAQSKVVSTVETNILFGLERALKKLNLSKESLSRKFSHNLACSSAAGGLRTIAVGLVPELTAKAARKAALGAGARVLETYAHKLSQSEMERIESLMPDIILLAGGTDGGDKKTIVYNAKVLAKSHLQIPIVVAGNKEAAKQVERILNSREKDVAVTENVMPKLEELNIEPAREVIRDIFMERIVVAKGLGDTKKFVDILMPTPAATLKATELLANGFEDDAGLGEILVIEVGGATTNVNSIAEGKPTQPKTIWKGLKGPYAKRTVEGDLGVRVSAESLLAATGIGKIIEKLDMTVKDTEVAEIESIVKELPFNIGLIPRSERQYAIDTALARVAVETAVERHVGSIEEITSPSGTFFLQMGKDLTHLTSVIGSGGPIVHSRNPRRILTEALFDTHKPFLLKPKNPQLLIDKDYVLWAMGLLSTIAPAPALKIMKRSLQPA